MTLYLLVLLAVVLYYLIFLKGYSVKNDSGDVKVCPSCQSNIKNQNSICPVCKETLRKPCSSCGEQLDVTWHYCPYCENPIHR